MKRILLHGLAIGVVVIGLAAVADALVLTDEERIEQLVDALDGEVDDAVIDEGLHFVETDREALEVTLANGRTTLYEEADADVAQRARDLLRPLRGSEIDVLQHTIDIDENEARLSLRARTRMGVVDANIDLVKHGERWLIWRARIR